MKYQEEKENMDLEEFSDLIRDVINEMGYSVEETELQEIEKDLRLLEENADVVDSHLFSCLLDKFNDFSTFASDPEQSLQQLAAKFNSPEKLSYSIHQKKIAKIPSEFDELITHGYERLQEVYLDIKRYERLINEMDLKNADKQPFDGDNNNCNDEQDIQSNKRNSTEPQQNFHNAEQSSSKVQKTRLRDGKENVKSLSTLGKLDPRVESRLLNQFLKKNALRRTQCPDPGRLPFTHDKRLKLEQYRREWAKNPPPGEQKRMALRWRIRELMTRRDIPHLRILTTTDECEVSDSDSRNDVH